MPKLKMITLEQLLEMKANEEEFVLLDTLTEDTYQEGHLPDAVNIPSDDVAKRGKDTLGKNDTIVTYCASYTCKASTVAAQKLLSLGYKKVLDFKAGKKAWEAAGFELVK
jgi:rhodanese-related sulfurtransferase